MTKLSHRLLSFLFIGIAGLAFGAQTPAPRPLKVLILFDMEGISEATSAAYPRFGTEEYKQARVSLTADVNAAVAGQKAAGVNEIVVVDGHGSGNSTSPDILENELMAPARVISRDAPFDIYMDSYDRSFDAIVAIAMHAGAGNKVGFLSHTYSGRGIGYTVNGEPFNETMIMAMGSGRFNIPMVAVSGDDELEKEIRRNLPWAGYATVKHAVDRSKAEPLARPEIDRRITEAVTTGIRKLGEARLFQKPGPYRFAVTFGSGDAARDAAQRAGSEFVCEGATVRVDSDDFVEGYRKSIRLFGSGATPAPTSPPAAATTPRFWGARNPRAPEY
jgi:D-amino peptidase